MRAACLIALIATALAVSQLTARADTPLDVIGVEKSINDLARRAQETGDHIAQAFAEQALRVIAEWKKANSGLINQAFDRLDSQSQALFRELNDTATRLENGEAVTFIDLQRSMATAGSVIAAFPGASKEPQVAFYWPTIILPTGEPKLGLHIIGSRLADANPTVSFAGGKIPVKKLSDNEIGFDVDRNSLPRDDKNNTKSVFRVEYRVSTSHWYNPFSWWSTEPRERDIEVTMLPNVPGTAVVTPHLVLETWEKTTDGPILIGGVGKDNTDRYGYALTPLQQEQGWIIDKDAQAKAPFDDNRGDGDGGSSCLGYDQHSFTDNSLVFLIQHGHKTSGFSKSDAHQNCRMWLQLKRLTKVEKDGDQIQKQLDWQKDVDVPLADNVIRYAVAISLYTGVSNTINNDQQIPYGLFQIFRDPKLVKFRPRPERDF
jgi:hypothetical protein